MLRFFILLLICSWGLLPQDAQALPLGPQDAPTVDTYVDYLPKYRRYEDYYNIDKIEYQERRTVIHFRYVVQETQMLTLYGGSHPRSWYLRTPPRMRGLEIQFKLLEIRNIRINNKMKLEAFVHLPQVDYKVQKGDVITCQVHFIRIPKGFRMLDLIEGQDGDELKTRLNCFDIMIKSADSPLLGTEKDAEQIKENFEQEYVDILQPQAPDPNKEAQEALANLARSQENQAPRDLPNMDDGESTVEPIDYHPRGMTSMEDLECSQRVILPNVTFRDNEAVFSGRIKAMENIETVVRYLKIYPKAGVRLHGHTDVFGDAYNNLLLSRERALSIKRELVQRGIQSERVKVYFYGGKQPLLGKEKGDPSNRRVEVEPVCDWKRELKDDEKEDVGSTEGDDEETPGSWLNKEAPYVDER